MKGLRSALVFLAVTASLKGFAQTTVRGQVINERGEKIEYVSLGFEADSVGTISDANGNFQ